jgi:hypothetical protein
MVRCISLTLIFLYRSETVIVALWDGFVRMKSDVDYDDSTRRASNAKLTPIVRSSSCRPIGSRVITRKAHANGNANPKDIPATECSLVCNMRRAISFRILALVSLYAEIILCGKQICDNMYIIPEFIQRVTFDVRLSLERGRHQVPAQNLCTCDCHTIVYPILQDIDLRPP